MKLKNMSRLGALVAMAAALCSASRAEAANITWRESLSKAQSEAKKSRKPVLIYVSATWCAPCKIMAKTTFKDPRVVGESKKWVMVDTDFDKQPKVIAKYKLEGAPVILLTRADGTVIAKTEGFMKADGLFKWMKSKYAAAKK